jgi:5-methylcytosine-specific restriction endonuclease McrA
MISINNIEFKTKKSAESHIRTIIYDLGEMIITKDNDEFILFCDLVSFKYSKTPTKFELFKTELSKTTLHLKVYFDDDEKNNIITSWKDCARRTHTTDSIAKQLNDAMRYAIFPDCLKFKYGKDSICAECKSTDNIQTDHLIPFSKLKNDFLFTQKEHPILFDSEPSVCQTVFKSSDIEFSNRWVEYHLKHASFQLLCRTCNIKKSNKASHGIAVAKYENKDEIKKKKKINILKIAKQKALDKADNIQTKIDQLK